MPAVFSNGIEKAEKETKDEYEKFRNFIREKITNLNNPPAKEDKKVEKDGNLVKDEDVFDPEKDEIRDDKNKKPEQKNDESKKSDFGKSLLKSKIQKKKLNGKECAINV